MSSESASHRRLVAIEVRILEGNPLARIEQDAPSKSKTKSAKGGLIEASKALITSFSSYF